MSQKLPPPAPDDLDAIAACAAGRAVVALACGARVDQAAIVTPDARHFAVTVTVRGATPYAIACLMWAGMHAIDALNPDYASPWMDREIQRIHELGEKGPTFADSRLPGSPWLTGYCAVRTHWDRVRRLAHALMDEPTMTGRRVLAVTGWPA